MRLDCDGEQQTWEADKDPSLSWGGSPGGCDMLKSNGGGRIGIERRWGGRACQVLGTACAKAQR